MEHVIIYSDPPIEPNDTREIQDLLRRENVFRTPFSISEFDPYDVFQFLIQKDQYGTDVCTILDRNIFTYIISLARGTEAEPLIGSSVGPRRLAAAVMTHLQCSNALIEPGVALHEYASTNGGEIAADERELFRIADNLHPRVYANIALGRTSRISADDLAAATMPLPIRNADFNQRPNLWKSSYVFALRLALLELEDLPQAEKFKRFLEWMHFEFVWSAPATLFASLYFSSQRSSGMLKHLRSKDRSKALSGVGNAAWDLTLLQHWGRCVNRQQDSQMLWLLCSRDSALLRIASDLVGADVSDQVIRERTEKLFDVHWGIKGKLLMAVYWDLLLQKGDPHRPANQSSGPPDLNNSVLKLEAEFRAAEVLL